MRPKSQDDASNEAGEPNKANEANGPDDGASPPPGTGTGPGNRVKDSAQQIWLAGLGAFAKAQEEGSKVFETLVKEGLGMQRKTQAAATEATSKMANMAGGLGARPAGPWDKLENIFEDRVAKALDRLGMPAAREVAALMARVDALEAQLAKISSARGAAAATATADASNETDAAEASKKATPRKRGAAAAESTEAAPPAETGRSAKAARAPRSAKPSESAPSTSGRRKPAAKSGQ
ncbi:MAG: hypothetical protein JWQ88_2874 [Rhodoferax sp.]|nr:hypothetical protein [Rhodoferax sp.]